MHIGFIGLGAMGSAMARNLAAGGHKVTAWNRSGGMLDGVAMVETPNRVFDADVVMTILSDDDAIRSVVLEQGLLARASPGLVHVVASTISVAFALELVSTHASAGVTYVSAPVLGRPDVAAKGALNIPGLPMLSSAFGPFSRSSASGYGSSETRLRRPMRQRLRAIL